MGEEVKETTKKVKAFTPVSIIVGILGAIALVLADAILGPTSGFVATAEVAVMTVVILALIQMYTPIKISFTEYAVIYAMVYGAAVSYPGWFFWVAALVKNATSPSWWPQYAKFLPSFISAPKDLYDLALKGQTAAPYGALTPQFTVGFILTLVVVFIGIFGTAPLRKQIVEVERLPFPATTAAFSVVSVAVNPPEKEKVPLLGSRRNWVVLGLTIGFLTVIFTQGYLITTLYPGAPAVPSFIGDETRRSGMLWGALPGAVIGLQMSSFFPWSWADYFAPMDAMLTITYMTLLIDFVFTPAAIYAGVLSYDPSYTVGDLYGIAWFSFPYKYHQLGVALLIGGVLGGYIAAYKLIISSWKDKKKEYDYTSPQLQWVISIISVLVLTGIGVMLGADIVSSFVLSLFLIYVLQMWGIRGLGLTNLQFTWDAHATSVIGEMLAPMGILGTAQPGAALVGFTMLGRFFTRGDIGASSFFESSRFAFLGRVKTIKIILISILIGLIIGEVGGELFQAYLTYSYGINHPTFGTFGAGLWQFALPRAYYYVAGGFTRYGPSSQELWLWWLLLILGLAVPAIRGRVAFSIPFSPIAAGLTFLMAGDGNLSWGYGFLVMLVTKWLILKLGGTKLDEQVARPFFGGALAGGLFGAVVSGVAVAMKAFAA